MFSVGVQSWVYREFAAEEMAAELADLPVEAVEPCGRHVPADADPGAVTAFRETVESAGLTVCGAGVYDVETVADATATLEVADGLGADYVSVEFSPGDTAVIEALLEGATERDLLLAVHNHGPGTTDPTVEDVMAVLEGRDQRLGACVDSGHYLRSGQPPEEVLSSLGERVHAVHFKDFADPETEVIPGDGQIGVDWFLSLLAEQTALAAPLVIEYEVAPADPTPAVAEICDRIG